MKTGIRKTGDIWLSIVKAMLFIVVLGVFFIGQIIFYTETLFFFWGNNILILLYAANLYFTSRLYNSFDFGNIAIQDVILSWILCLIVSNGLQYLILCLIESMMLPVAGLLIVSAVQLVLIIPLSLVIDKIYYRLNPASKAIIIYGREGKAGEYSRIIGKHSKRFDIQQTISQNEPRETLMESISGTETVFFLNVDGAIRERLLEYCYQLNKQTYITPTFSGVLINTAAISWISNTPIFLPKRPEPDMGTRILKRGMDIIISLLGIVLLSWLMLIVWIVTRLYDKSPAVYRQVRVTKGGKRFTLYKFRSMRPDAEDDGLPRLTSKGDDRITPFGRFIRSTRIDELPQLFNVFSGAMSLVGPRPERPEIARQYEEIYPNFPFRTKVKAGMTGLAQVYGRYDTAPDEKLFLDVIYIETLSIWQDIKLLLQTIKVIVKPSGTEGVPDGATTAIRNEEE